MPLTPISTKKIIRPYIMQQPATNYTGMNGLLSCWDSITINCAILQNGGNNYLVKARGKKGKASFPRLQVLQPTCIPSVSIFRKGEETFLKPSYLFLPQKTMYMYRKMKAILIN